MNLYYHLTNVVDIVVDKHTFGQPMEYNPNMALYSDINM